jgi:hypothetical protein
VESTFARQAFTNFFRRTQRVSITRQVGRSLKRLFTERT